MIPAHHKKRYKLMHREAKTQMTAGQAFQLSALLGQKLSALGLTFDDAKHWMDRPSFLAKAIRVLKREKVDLPKSFAPQPHCVVYDGGDRVHFYSMDDKAVDDIQPFIHWRDDETMEQIRLLYPGEVRELSAQVFRCEVHTHAEYFLTILREATQHQGPDAKLSTILYQRNCLWTIYDILGLIMKEINHGEDPLGFVDFKNHAGAWFPICIDKGAWNARNYFDIPPKMGMMSVSWEEWRRTKLWKIRIYKDMDDQLSRPDVDRLYAPGRQIFFKSDPRIKEGR